MSATATMQTTAMRASMSPYSTIVAPSSSRTRLRIAAESSCMVVLLGGGGEGTACRPRVPGLVPVHVGTTSAAAERVGRAAEKSDSGGIFQAALASRTTEHPMRCVAHCGRQDAGWQHQDQP